MAEAPSGVLTCPQCGADNPLPSGTRLVTCAYCDATLWVDRSGLVSHYWVPRLQDAEKGEAALRRWMAGNTTVKGLDKEATVTAAVPQLFPVWMFRLGRSGGEVVRVEPAAPTAEPGLTELQVPAGQLEAWRGTPPGEPAPMEAEVPLETARSWLVQREGEDVEIHETALVHLPLWRFDYRFRGEGWQALVDGSTGAVMASRFPAKAEGPFWLVAALGLILFGAAGLIVANPVLKLLAFGVVAVPLFLLAFLVARKV